MLAGIFAGIESTFHFHPFHRAMRPDEFEPARRPPASGRCRVRHSVIRSSRSRADESAGATQFLGWLGEHQRVADTHAAPPRAQIDDLVAVMTLNCID